MFAVATTPGVSPQPAKEVEIPLGIPLRGTVTYPDGSPAAGAKVVATATCRPREYINYSDAQTADDGSFIIPSFDTSCGKILFTAEKRDGSWMKTGTGIFYPGPNGTAPEIELVGGDPPEPITIRLDFRGGELEASVWDESVGGPIRAGLMMECPDSWCGAVSFATEDDGFTAAPLFVFPRRYSLSLNWYLCGTKTYFPDEDRPRILVDVVEGQRQLAVLRINVPLISARPSFDNWEGVPCSAPTNTGALKSRPADRKE